MWRRGEHLHATMTSGPVQLATHSISVRGRQSRGNQEAIKRQSEVISDSLDLGASRRREQRVQVRQLLTQQHLWGSRRAVVSACMQGRACKTGALTRQHLGRSHQRPSRGHQRSSARSHLEVLTLDRWRPQCTLTHTPPRKARAVGGREERRRRRRRRRRWSVNMDHRFGHQPPPLNSAPHEAEGNREEVDPDSRAGSVERRGARRGASSVLRRVILDQIERPPQKEKLEHPRASSTRTKRHEYTTSSTLRSSSFTRGKRTNSNASSWCPNGKGACSRCWARVRRRFAFCHAAQ